MSTNRSVGRSTATQNDRSASAQENNRSAATYKNKKDRSRLCAFTFADGRQCRTPRCSGHLHLCYFHAQKEAERLAAKQVGEDISRFLPAKLLTACDLSGAMARVFCAIARGDVKPKVASTLAYLSQSMVQSIPIARHEYCEAFGSDAWRREIRASFNVPAPQPKPAPQPTPKPAPPARPPASSASTPTAKPASSPAPQPTVNCHSERSDGYSSSNSPLPPAPSPHKPLPPTSTEFAQQVLAGLPTASLPATPHVQPAPPNPRRAEPPTNCHSERSDERPTSGASPESYREESAFSSSSAPSTTPAPAPQPTETPANSRSSLATHHSPLPQAPQPTSPQQSQPTQNSQHNSQPAPASPAPPSVPPGFGAPANWDVLIPPKPRRRFSRHWQLLE